MVFTVSFCFISLLSGLNTIIHMNDMKTTVGNQNAYLLIYIYIKIKTDVWIYLQSFPIYFVILTVFDWCFHTVLILIIVFGISEYLNIEIKMLLIITNKLMLNRDIGNLFLIFLIKK